MAKELIVSVNGREKKIAIVENDQVTEFYIERGDDHQGIVGNIYKGRVMRVLPGMQSAFVDIGLDRDAFLYVSDFFDEEEEFERIVMEKSKKGDHAAAERAAAERIEAARVEREQRIEAAQEKVEILEEMSDPDELEEFDAEEEFAAGEYVAEEATTEFVSEPEAPVLVEEVAPEEKRRRRRRDRRRGRGDREERETSAALPFPVLAEPVLLSEAIAGFERIVDEEESASDNGEMLKDAIIQERLTDEARALEYDLDEPAPKPAPVAFERIADYDDEEPASVVVPVLETIVAAPVFVEETPDETPVAVPSFERISDDEEPVDAAPVAEEPAPPKKSRSATRRRNKQETVVAEPEVAPAEVVEETALEPEAEAKPTKSKRKTTSKKKAAPPVIEEEVAPAEPPAEKKPASKKKSSRKKKTANAEAEPLPDAEASVTDSAGVSEFATRRGGRRRRRKPEGGSNGSSNGGGGNSSGPEEVAADEGGGEEEERSDNRRDKRSSGRNRRERERPPTITDLLREGQEIIVQIAKEPIAKKGARITSHIALPGRFLVYMPTVEHLGVSRKIDSDAERSRLRKLITAIRNEEDVPSGGFIVRTAGVGISEDDLRTDARYLVRTWQDMRRTAERSKAPALVHRDLDLVQRILRDQISNDFTAIRVDSEEEYLEIVEFVNRIQPHLVNRVKLYTRETPILEAYGVQEEIDKAIKPRVWLRSGGYLVINQTEALVAIDVNTGKFVGRGNARLEDTITRTNLEAVDEIARQIRLRDLGGIIVLDLIDMEDRRNRQRVLQNLHEALQGDKSPTKVLSFNDFGLVIMTRKRVKQSLERTLCAPCSYCQGAGLIKSAQTICYEILEEARRLARGMADERIKQTTLRVHPEVARSLRSTESDVLSEVEDYLGAVDLTSDQHLHQEQFDFAFV